MAVLDPNGFGLAVNGWGTGLIGPDGEPRSRRALVRASPLAGVFRTNRSASPVVSGNPSRRLPLPHRHGALARSGDGTGLPRRLGGVGRDARRLETASPGANASTSPPNGRPLEPGAESRGMRPVQPATALSPRQCSGPPVLARSVSKCRKRSNRALLRHIPSSRVLPSSRHSTRPNQRSGRNTRVANRIGAT